MKSSYKLASEILMIILVTLGLIYLKNYSFSSTSQKINLKNTQVQDISKINHSKKNKKSGLEINHAKDSYSGLTLIPSSGTEKTELINNQGKVVHFWNVDAERARLLDNCNLLVIHGSKWGISQPKWQALRKTIREYDWDGKVVWEHKSPSKIHHDIQRLKNGNTLFLRRSPVAQKFRNNIPTPIKKYARITSDIITEVDPRGKTVWEWALHEHIDPSSCGEKPCYWFRKNNVPKNLKYDWSHTNTIRPLPENKWFDKGDVRFRPGNIMIIVRNWSTIMIIDKKSKKIVWKYNKGISFGHDAHMIPKGLPGAGNILFFNNGVVKQIGKKRYGASKIEEINPVKKSEVWHYKDEKNFFSHSAGSIQRLQNGNTLISEDIRGRVFEVTPSGETVWQYGSAHRISRAHKYPLKCLKS